MTQLVDYWQHAMNEKQASKPVVTKHFNKFFGGTNAAQMARMLIKPVWVDLVHAAFEVLNGTSTLGIDGVQVSIYKMFLEFFSLSCWIFTIEF